MKTLLLKNYQLFCPVFFLLSSYLLFSDWQAEELLQRLIKVRTETDFLFESETQSNPPNSELNYSLVSNIEFNRSDYLKKVNYLKNYLCFIPFNFHSYLICNFQELDALDGITIEADVNTMDSSINQSKARGKQLLFFRILSFKNQLVYVFHFLFAD